MSLYSTQQDDFQANLRELAMIVLGENDFSNSFEARILRSMVAACVDLHVQGSDEEKEVGAGVLKAILFQARAEAANCSVPFT